jgi:hypothetical protein
MVALIVACEIGFWILVVLGLVARYPLRRRRLGLVLLALTPAVDVVLLVATGIDLRGGASATFAHGLAAIYLGFSLAYGHKMIAWADTRFAYHFAGGPAPVKLYGGAYARECWRDVVRTTAAVVIAAGTIAGLVAMVDDPARTTALSARYAILGLILAAEILWAASYTIWPRRQTRRV